MPPVQLVAPSGNIYDGDVPAGAKSGLFKCHKTGIIYDGEFLDGTAHGFGKMFYKDGDVYTGQWSKWAKSGLGEYKFSHGGVYRGMWVNNKYHGPGEYIYANKNIYRGSYVEGLMEGSGVMFWSSDGDVYTGDFAKDKREGFGETRFKDSTGGTFGEMRDGEKHGKVRWIFKTGGIEDKIWEKGSETKTACDMRDVLPKVDLGERAFDSIPPIIMYHTTAAAKAKKSAAEAIKGLANGLSV